MSDVDALFTFDADPDIEELSGILADPRTAVIRTSDRSNFRRCRRRWNWQSHLRHNLTPIESASPLWFGSGIHYALEDFHGHRLYQYPRDALKAYVKATHRMSKAKARPQLIPYDFLELTALGINMLDYYSEQWLIARDPLTTYIHDGKPQVEVHAVVRVPFSNEAYDNVLYAVTLDRIVIDEDQNLWIVDYKTAKQIQTHFFQTDPQISAYCWVAQQLYTKPIAGFIYQQHRKSPANLPTPLANGRLSTSRQQSITSHRLYRQSLIKLYGEVLRAPKENVDFLNWLAEQETDTQDRFIRRDRIYRNKHQAEAEGTKLLLELEEMLNPNLPLYPSPTRDCGHLCAFQTACVSLDDGSDWQAELEYGFTPKDTTFDGWRDYL